MHPIFFSGKHFPRKKKKFNSVTNKTKYRRFRACIRISRSELCFFSNRRSAKLRRASSTWLRSSWVPRWGSNSQTCRPTWPFKVLSQGSSPPATFSFHIIQFSFNSQLSLWVDSLNFFDHVLQSTVFPSILLHIFAYSWRLLLQINDHVLIILVKFFTFFVLIFPLRLF